MKKRTYISFRTLKSGSFDWTHISKHDVDGITFINGYNIFIGDSLIFINIELPKNEEK